MDYDKLICQLRDFKVKINGEKLTPLVCLDAATAIETLRADLARVTAERDAAISDMVFITRTYPVELCDDLVCKFCVHFPNAQTGCLGWEKNECFEWRGIKKED